MGYHSPILTGEETNLKGIALGFLVVPTTDFLVINMLAQDFILLSASSIDLSKQVKNSVEVRQSIVEEPKRTMKIRLRSRSSSVLKQALSRVLPRNSSNNNFGGLGFGIGPADVKFTISARDGFKVSLDVHWSPNPSTLFQFSITILSNNKLHNGLALTPHMDGMVGLTLLAILMKL